MPVTIDRLDTRVDVTPPEPGSATPPAGTPTGGQDPEVLRRALRPIVLEILAQELAEQLRIRGLE